MDKKGSNPYLIVGFLILLLLILGGYISLDIISKEYSLENVKAERENLNLGENTPIFFDVVNKADLTFLGKIELEADEDCFRSNDEEVLSEISPHSKRRSFITLYSQRSHNNEGCEGRPFKIKIKLKDASGKILDTESITIGILGS